MKTLKSIVTEKSSDVINKETLKYGDRDTVNELKNRYYGVSDHLQSLVEALNSFNGQTGIFGDDLTNAKKALKAFDKISLGKYL
jgi:hypothetical protein